MKRALITGAAGFIGRHFHLRLLADDWDVSAFDIAPGQSTLAVRRVDALDWFRMDEAHYDLVIHAAAVVGGRASIEGSPLEVAANLALDAELFRWAARTRQGRIVYFSSSAAYPLALQTGERRTWLREDHLVFDAERSIMPDATYGWAKLTGELLAGYAARAGLAVHVFRPFSGYGADQALAYPFPAFVARARRRQDPFVIWGDGTQVRDWVHVDDIVEAVLRAVSQDIRGPVNIGSGVPVTFNELARLVCEIAGYEPDYQHLPSAPSGVRFRVADIAKLRSYYVPKISLREGVERALTVVRA